MATLQFEQLEFSEQEDHIRVDFLRTFYFNIPKEELNLIGEFKIDKNSISFKSTPEKKAQKKFNNLIAKHMTNLKNKLYNKPTIYIHKNSGIPLIGSSYFGLIDRNTNIIEIRPITGCNLNCIYCSVDEGKDSRKQTDFIVEKDYLIEELKQLIPLKENNSIEMHIGTQGEPFLYQPILELIEEMAAIPQVKIVSVNTNAVLITKQMVDKLKKAGLTRLNVSINTLDQKLADKIAGTKINLKQIIETIKYAANHMEVTIAPVFLEGINDKEMEGLIQLAKSLPTKHKIRVGIQNFLFYKGGRKPVKQVSWDKFMELLGQLEKKHNFQLILTKDDFSVEKTKKLPKPFKRGDIIKAKVVCHGRQKNEMLAVASDRVISIIKCPNINIGQTIKVRIIRDKHNIFAAENT
ncbi:radical SAM protein [Nanoarchaeota archaeon]